jgi:hypothetical protein
MRFSIAAAVLLLVPALVAGCGRGGAEPTHRVEGVVRLDGQPLTQGYVLFTAIPEGAEQRSHTARGEIGPDGRYRLTTFAKNDGAVAGRHKVVVVAIGGADPDREDTLSTPLPAIPEKYTSPQTTDLEVTVQRGTNQIDIDLR